MTDAGRLLPSRGATRSGDPARLLREIAKALNLPPSVFSPSLAPMPSGAEPSTAECVAILAAFSRTPDPDLRRRCLRMLERGADG